MTVYYGTIEVNAPIGRKCNLCGKECDDEYISAYAEWGYCSRKDGQTWNLDLCEVCSGKLKEWVEESGGRIDIENRLDYRV